MRKIVAVGKALSFILSTLFAYIIYAAGLIFIRLLRKRYEPWRNQCFRIWGKLSLWSLSMNLVIDGKPPEPPFFLVSNHLSYTDIPVYAYCLKTTFVSKEEIKHWPVVGLMARSLGIIFINRKRKSDVKRVNTIISQRINENQGVVLFPEGRTSAGDGVVSFKPSLLQHAAVEGIDVHFAAIRYQTGENDPPAFETVSWWEDVSLLKHLIRLASNRSITVQVTFGKESIRKEDRKELARELQNRVESAFTPMTPKKNIRRHPVDASES